MDFGNNPLGPRGCQLLQKALAKNDRLFQSHENNSVDDNDDDQPLPPVSICPFSLNIRLCGFDRANVTGHMSLMEGTDHEKAASEKERDMVGMKFDEEEIQLFWAGVQEIHREEELERMRDHPAANANVDDMDADRLDQSDQERKESSGSFEEGMKGLEEEEEGFVDTQRSGMNCSVVACGHMRVRDQLRTEAEVQEAKEVYAEVCP